jgi:hypothetical protein
MWISNWLQKFRWRPQVGGLLWIISWKFGLCKMLGISICLNEYQLFKKHPVSWTCPVMYEYMTSSIKRRLTWYTAIGDCCTPNGYWYGTPPFATAAHQTVADRVHGHWRLLHTKRWAIWYTAISDSCTPNGGRYGTPPLATAAHKTVTDMVHRHWRLLHTKRWLIWYTAIGDCFTPSGDWYGTPPLATAAHQTVTDMVHRHWRLLHTKL